MAGGGRELHAKACGPSLRRRGFTLPPTRLHARRRSTIPPNMATALVFTLCLAVGLGYFGYQMYGRVGALLSATGRPTFDRLGERLANVAVFFFGQKKFVRPE